MFLVYLAGKIHGLTQEEANKWRKEASELFNRAGIKTHNPLNGFTVDGQYEPQEIVMRKDRKSVV